MMNYATSSASLSASSLIEAQFLKRYKRFFADVKLATGETVVAHVPNTGSLRSVCDAATIETMDTLPKCRLLKNNDPKRKLAYTLEQVNVKGTWVGVNTHRANELALEAFTEKTIAHWRELKNPRREVKISEESRLDLCFEHHDGRIHYVEVKSVTLARGESGKKTALFPDSVTTRGQKHLRELIALNKPKKSTSELLFVIQRNDCQSFLPAEDIDPDYAEGLRAAKIAGVLISAYSVDLTAASAKITDKSIQIII